jgi:hypothetical protein
MLLKMEKDVNARLRGLQVCTAGEYFLLGKDFRAQKIKKCNNALAHGISCGRLGSFDAPLM